MSRRDRHDRDHGTPERDRRERRGASAEASESDAVSPQDAFELLGHETRLEILRVLVEAKGGPMSFSNLRERVGMRDASQFNYHLKKLDGPFVRKTDEGYAVRHAGINVVRAIVTGSFTAHPRIAPFRTGGRCVECDGPLVAYYEREMMFVECSACEKVHSMGMFPPGALAGRTDEEALAAYERWVRRDYALAIAGVCGTCGGRMIRSIGDAEDLPIKLREVDPDDFTGNELGARYECERCDVWIFETPGVRLLDDPAVVGFYRDHGVDLTRVPHWELDWCISNERTTVLSEDPFRVRVTIRVDDEELRATLDGDLAVVDTERGPAGTPAVPN